MALPSIPQLLGEVLSSDNAQRARAESALAQLAKTPGFYAELVVLITSPESSEMSSSMRLVALSVLRKGVIAIPLRPLMDVLEQLLAWLSSVDQLTDNVVRQTASVVAHGLIMLEHRSDDGSDDDAVPCFGETADMVMKYVTSALSSPHVALQYRFVLVVEELLQPLPANSFLYDDIVSAAPALMAIMMANPFATETASPEAVLQLQVAAVKALHEIYLRCWGKAAETDEGSRPLLTLWTTHFAELRARACTPCKGLLPHTPAPGDDDRPAPPGLSLAFHLLSFFADTLALSRWIKRHGAEAPLLEQLLQSLQADTVVYHATVERDDDEALVLRQHVAKRWGLVGDLVSAPSMRPALMSVVAADEGAALFSLLAAFSYLAAAEADAWAADPNAFLRQEADREDAIRWTVRDTAADVFQRCVKQLGPVFLHNVLESLNELICSGEPSQPWKEREVALFFMEYVVRHCRKQLLRCGVADFSTFVDVLLARDVGGHVVLAARALSLLAALLHFMRRHDRAAAAVRSSRVLQQAVASLSSSNAPLLLRGAACKLISEVLPMCEDDVVAAGFGPGQAAVLSLLGEAATTEELLYLVFDVLTSWVTRVRRIAASPTAVPTTAAAAMPTVTPAQCHIVQPVWSGVFGGWRARIQDPNLGELVTTLVKQLLLLQGVLGAPGGDCDDGLAQELPWFCHVLCGTCSMAEYCAVPHVITILTELFRYGCSATANQAAETLLGSLCDLLLATDESAIMESSYGCLAALLRRCPQVELVQVRVAPSRLKAAQSLETTFHSSGTAYDYNDANVGSSSAHVVAALDDEERIGQPLSVVLVAIVLRVLHPSREEAALLNVGDALVAVTENASHFTADEVRCTIRAMVSRLSSVRTDTVAQQLIVPLSVLLQHFPQAFLQLVAEEGAVETTFSRWLPRIHQFLGRRDTQRACNALLDVLVAHQQTPFPVLEAEVRCKWSEGAAGLLGGFASGKVKSKGKGKKSRGAESGPPAAAALPLRLAMFVAVGKGILGLLPQLSPAGDGEEGWDDDVDDSEDEAGGGGGARLFREDDEDEDEDEFDAENRNGDEATGEVEEETWETEDTAEGAQRRRDRQRRVKEELGSVFLKMQPLLPEYSAPASAYFSPDDLTSIAGFLQYLQQASP